MEVFSGGSVKLNDRIAKRVYVGECGGSGSAFLFPARRQLPRVEPEG